MAKFTKNAIVKSLLNLLEKKSFDKITVKDIVDDCGINRKTFYYYFSDIYDLAEYMFRTEVSKFADSITDETTVEETMNSFCDLIEKNKRIVKHAFGLTSKSELERFFDEIFEKLFKERVRSIAGNRVISDTDIDAISRIIVFSFVGSTTMWIYGGFKPSEREKLKRVCIIMQDSIDLMIDNLCKTE